MATIVVTGGAGFIGSHVVEGFVSTGHTVHIIDNLSSGLKANVIPGATLHELDIRDIKSRELLVSLKPDVVVHAAAQISVRVSMEDPTFDAQVNVAGLVNLLQAFQTGHSPFFIFISTGGAIYGEQDSFPATEDHPIRPASVYGLAKRVGEMYLDLWKREYKLSYAVLRLANVYGPRQNPHGEAGVVAIFNEKLIAGQIPTINGSGEQTRDFVFVKDVAAAAQQVFEKRIEGTFNIGTGRETSVNTLFSMVAQAVKPDARPNYAPGKAGEQMRSCIDSSAAQRAFGWKPVVAIDEGCRQTAEFFRSRH